MVAKGPPIAAHSIIMRPGLVLTIFQRSLSWPFFAQAINDHNPLNGSFAPAESAVKANVTVNAISGVLVTPGLGYEPRTLHALRFRQGKESSVRAIADARCYGEGDASSHKISILLFL